MVAASSSSNKRFRVAFSFAGEKRDFVSQVAALIAERFGEEAVLYDKYHEAEFADANLAFSLPKFYHEQTDLIVAVFCSNYDSKEWCGLEWRAIFALIKEQNTKPVMLTRFDQVDGVGLHGLAGFVELDQKTPGQAATLILERLALNEGRPKGFYIKPVALAGKPLSTSIPNNLPRLQPFFGRVEELKKIREAMDPDNRIWGALIDGPGGMGKTSLAIRAAYDCSSEQFERIVFVSVKDRELDDDGIRELGVFILPGFIEMLNELAFELGEPQIVNAPEDQRARQLLLVLRPMRVLLLFDNLESLPKADRDQLFTFIKRLPLGCKAILTSRRRIGSGSEELILEQLTQSAALEILSDLARRNPLLACTSKAERIALYEQTSGKPLLLRWVAGQLGRGSCRTLNDALAFLRTCPPENDPLEFIFGDLTKEFDADEEKLLCALSYFSLPAKWEYLCEITELEQEPAEKALRTLTNRSLVVSNQEATNYSLVPMVAEFLRKHRPEVIADTGDRLEHRALALIVQNGFRGHRLFPVLDSAWPTVAPALPLFLGGSNQRLQLICDALTLFLEFTGRWDESLSLDQHAEAKAVAAADFPNAGWRAYRAGWIRFLRKEATPVLDCARRAERYWQDPSVGLYERAFAVRLRGMGCQLMGDYPAAIDAYKEALEMRSILPDQGIHMANDMNAVAVVEQLLGDYAAAESNYREALSLARSIDFIAGVANFTGNLAGLEIVRENWPIAEALASEALQMSEDVGRQELIADNSHRLAETLVRRQRNLEALPHVQRAVKIYTKLRSQKLDSARATLRGAKSGA